MNEITFISTKNDTLIIKGSELTVTNIFGDTYKGMIGAYDGIVTKSRLGLQYLSRAYYEYKRHEVIESAYLAGFDPSTDELNLNALYKEALEYLTVTSLIY
jgi:hypothetical protein